MKQHKTSPDATQGEKRTEIKTRFWTNKITGDEGFKMIERDIPAWIKRLAGNEPRDVAPRQPFPFAMTLDAEAVIGRALVKRSIVLPSIREMDKYVDQKLKQPPGSKDTSAYDA